MYGDEINLIAQTQGAVTFYSLNADARENMCHSLAEQGESSEAVKELVAAALVEVQRRQGGGRLF